MDLKNILWPFKGTVDNTGRTIANFEIVDGNGRIAKALAACLVAFLISFVGLVSLAEPATTATRCSGVQVDPSEDLAAVAGAKLPGTTFCIRDGSYKVSRAVEVQSGDRFVGVYSDGTRPSVSTTRALHVFDANGSRGAVVRGLKVSGAIGNDRCEPDCGRGIGGGTNLRVINVRATGNANQGIGGTGPGLLVARSIVDNNGSYSFSRDGGPVSAAGIKSVNSITVLNSKILKNYWAGVWCDIQCGSFVVKNSTLSGNGKVGIHDEISSGAAVFSGNTIRNNGNLRGATRPSGLLIVSSRHVDAYDNDFGSNAEHGIQVADDGRNPGVADVSVRKNKMKNDGVLGCNLRGVTCRKNR